MDETTLFYDAQRGKCLYWAKRAMEGKVYG
jgi:hypothetical protein